MSDEVKDPLLTAVAIVRGRLLAQSGESTTQDSLEAGVLELSMSADPLAVVSAMALLASTALTLSAALTTALGGNELTAGQMLDTIETTIKRGS